MKLAIKDPGFRHLIIKELSDKEEGLKKINQLKDIGITYICGGYEVGKDGDRHAHFLVYSQFDRRYIEAHKPFSNRFRMPKNKTTKNTKIPADEISSVISYILKNGEAYEYNNDQQYHIISNYEELIDEAIETHKEAQLPATEKLIKYFRHKSDLHIDINEPKSTQYKKLVYALCTYNKDRYKLIDENIIHKQTMTVMNDLFHTHTQDLIYRKLKHKLDPNHY